jgi:hypothetical protein
MLTSILAALTALAGLIAATVRVFAPKGPPVEVQIGEEAAAAKVALAVDNTAIKARNAIVQAAVDAPKTQAADVRAFRDGDV